MEACSIIGTTELVTRCRPYNRQRGIEAKSKRRAIARQPRKSRGGRRREWIGGCRRCRRRSGKRNPQRLAGTSGGIDIGDREPVNCRRRRKCVLRSPASRYRARTVSRGDIDIASDGADRGRTSNQCAGGNGNG